MKKITTISALLIFVAFSASAQLSGFNGTWKINKEKSNFPSDQLYLSQITITINGDSILTNRTYTDPNYQEYPFQENMTLDGKEAKIVIYDMPRVAKARKGDDGSILIDTKTTFNGGSGDENLVAIEIWKTDGKTLTLDVVNQMMGQEMKSTVVYDKVK